MQPYQEASEESNRQAYRPIETPLKIASSAGRLGLGLGIGNRIASMLNKHVPTDLAMKGLAKIDPRLGKFLSLGQEMGHSPDEMKEFITKKIGNEEEQNISKKGKQNKNIIEQYSPELHQFIANEVAGGRSPIEAGAIAQGDKRFSNAIKKLTKDHKTPWSSIIESIYGSGQTAGALKGNTQPQQAQQAPQPQANTQGDAKWDSVAKALKNILDS